MRVLYTQQRLCFVPALMLWFLLNVKGRAGK